MLFYISSNRAAFFTKFIYIFLFLCTTPSLYSMEASKSSLDEEEIFTKIRLISPCSHHFKEKIIKPNLDEANAECRSVEDTSNPFFRIHGCLYLTYCDKKGKEYLAYGSGVLVGPYHVLTAGHNLYDHDNKDDGNKEKKRQGLGMVEKVIFIAGENGDSYAHKPVKGVNFLCHEKFRNKNDSDYDFGMVILEKPIGNELGWAGILAPDHREIEDKAVSVTGYPSEMEENQGKKDRFVMYTAYGEFSSILEKSFLLDKFHFSEGLSGGGIWIINNGEEPQVIGVNSLKGEEEDGTPHNVALRITEKNFIKIMQWMGEYPKKEPWAEARCILEKYYRAKSNYHDTIAKKHKKKYEYHDNKAQKNENKACKYSEKALKLEQGPLNVEDSQKRRNSRTSSSTATHASDSNYTEEEEKERVEDKKEKEKRKKRVQGDENKREKNKREYEGDKHKKNRRKGNKKQL